MAVLSRALIKGGRAAKSSRDRRAEEKRREAIKQRGWVLANGGMYRPVNPTKVIANEIAKLKRNLEKNIMKIKSEALVDLEALYLQNNLKDVQSKEF